MISNTIQKYANIPLIAVFCIMIASVSALASLATSSRAGALPYSPQAITSMRDDHCYDRIADLSGRTGPFGTPNFGMVNAIVNLPVYDWDQSGPGIDTPYSWYKMFGRDTPGNSPGLRGSLDGKSVGYADRFDFSVTPVPNLNWIQKYITKQAMYDVGMLTVLMGGRNNVPQPKPDLIANPFIYTQSAIIDPYGFPKFQAVRNSLVSNGREDDVNTGGAIDDGVFNPGVDEDGNPLPVDIEDVINGVEQPGIGELGQDTIIDAINSGNNSLWEHRNTVTGVAGNSGGILGAINTIRSGGASNVDNLIGNLLSIGPIRNLASSSYTVNGADMRDRCYETPTSLNHVPAYAFSVANFGIPITLPGWIYSPFTLLAGKGFSSSGMTIYAGGSANGKDMLDCYGRAVQPIMTPHPTRKVSDFLSFGLSINTVINGVIMAGLTAAGVPDLARSIPAFIPYTEDYTSGFAFLFRLNNATRSTLPAHLNNRAIQPNATKTADINYKFLLGGNGHDDSQNGQQFNPDLYLKLYEPFHLTPSIQLDAGEGTRSTPPDGRTVNVNIGVNKRGYDRTVNGSGETTRYEPSSTRAGGPTFDPNEGSDGRSFSQARVYKMVVQPGTSVNPIDESRRGSQPGHYRTPAVNPSTDPCEFFASELRTAEQDVNDATFNCGEIARKDLRMRNGSATEEERRLYNQPEVIPAETPPGTKFCYAVYFTSYTNDVKTAGNHWWTEADRERTGHNTPADTTQLSRAHCIVSGYKPSFQVRGGDLIVDGQVDTGLNTKEFLAAPPDPDETKRTRTYGSWAEYGVIASDRITNIASGGLHRTGMPNGWSDIGYLTFSNNRDGEEKKYGHYDSSLDDGFTRVARQFTSMSNAVKPLPTPSGDIDIASLESGVYLIGEGTNRNLVNSRPESTLEKNRSVILLVGNNARLTIAQDIKIPPTYDSISELSQVVIAPATDTADFRINIQDSVSNVDAWLINPRGSINTCYQPGASGDENRPRALSSCNNQLQVNGPVSAEQLILRRSGGKDQGTTTDVHQSVPGENFNLRPDSYIWAAQYVNDGGKKYITTHSRDLPPRY